MINEFTIGQVFSKSFEVFGKNIVFMLIVALLVSIPTSLISMGSESALFVMFSGLGILIMSFLAQGIVTYGVFQHLTGRTVSFSDSLGIALRRFFPILILTLIVTFLTGLGYLLLIIPGVILYLMFWVVVPVTVVEKGSLGHALKRSRELTSGYRGRIFFLMFLLGLLTGLFSFVGGLLGVAILSGGPEAGSGAASLLIQIPLNMIFSGLASALSSVVVTVGYYTLRHEVEGVAPEDLASVFE